MQYIRDMNTDFYWCETPKEPGPPFSMPWKHEVPRDDLSADERTQLQVLIAKADLEGQLQLAAYQHGNLAQARKHAWENYGLSRQIEPFMRVLHQGVLSLQSKTQLPESQCPGCRAQILPTMTAATAEYNWGDDPEVCR